MSSDDDLLNDDEIKQLLDEAQAGGAPAGAGGAELPRADDPTSAPSASAGQASDGEATATNEKLDSSGAGGSLEPERASVTGSGDAISAPIPTSDAAASAESMLNQVESGLDAALAGSPASRNLVSEADGAQPFELTEFDSTGKGSREFGLGTLDDLELDLQIELGRTELLIDEVMSLREGAVVPLDKLAGDPVDVLVNGRLLARGEVLILNDKFCVRVAEIVSTDI